VIGFADRKLMNRTPRNVECDFDGFLEEEARQPRREWPNTRLLEGFTCRITNNLGGIDNVLSTTTSFLDDRQRPIYESQEADAMHKAV